ncbi:MAG: hypothetical protein HRU19_03780 [Pseudobacteriovorax sp.]|nr:hypothetical protein [Pseudobacteriovorax sp.]
MTTTKSIFAAFFLCFSSNLFAVENYNANHCEFYLDSIAVHRTGHYGIPITEVVTQFKVNVPKQDVVALGQWVEYYNRITNQVEQDMIYANLHNVYDPFKVQLILNIDHPQAGNIGRDLIRFANFIEARDTNGTVKRLWQSNSGTNYEFADVMAAPTYTFPVAYGNGEYSNEYSSLFNEKKSCN